MNKRTTIRKAPYNLSLPVRMMEDFDETLTRSESRSAVVEQLIYAHLKKMSPKHDMKPIFYAHCKKCDKLWSNTDEYQMRYHYCDKCHQKCEFTSQKPDEQSS